MICKIKLKLGNRIFYIQVIPYRVENEMSEVLGDKWSYNFSEFN